MVGNKIMFMFMFANEQIRLNPSSVISKSVGRELTFWLSPVSEFE